MKILCLLVKLHLFFFRNKTSSTWVVISEGWMGQEKGENRENRSGGWWEEVKCLSSAAFGAFLCPLCLHLQATLSFLLSRVPILSSHLNLKNWGPPSPHLQSLPIPNSLASFLHVAIEEFPWWFHLAIQPHLQIWDSFWKEMSFPHLFGKCSN